MTKTLRQPQAEAVSFGTRAGRWVLADPPGAGKTATVLTWVARIGLRRGLIVAPLHVVEHWDEEALLWQPDLIVVNGTGTPKQREKARETIRNTNMASVLVVNYETLRGDIDHLLTIPFDTFIADEAHRLRNRAALQTKAALKIARRVEHMCLATGTPVINRAEELWSLLAMCKPKQYKSFWRWVEQHFHIELRQYGHQLVREIGHILPGHAEMIRAEAQDILIQRDLEELLPWLPPVVTTILPVKMSPAERKTYDHFMEHHWVELGDDVLQAPSTVAALTRARQMSSDWGSIDPSLSLGSKVKATVELVDDLAPAKVLVLTQYRETAARISLELSNSKHPGHVSLVVGAMSKGRRHEEVKGFTRGDNRVLVGTIGSVGEGTDGLQVAQHIVLVDRSWSPAENDQAIGRIRRDGQEGAMIQVYHVTLADSVDDMVARALAEKRDIVASLNLTRPV